MSTYVAVFDVGKTNKKLCIFDERMQLVDSYYDSFPAIEETAEHHEQTPATTEWLLNGLRDFAARYSIAAIGVTTHGATLAGVDAQGALAHPVVAYTSDPGATFHEDFYARFGDARSLHRAFATPALGSLTNAGLGAFYLKQRHPAAWEKIRHLLPYPQYFAYVLTGCAGAEPTMLGCHSYLLDFATRNYSRIAREAGLLEKLPTPIQSSGSVLGTVTPAIVERCGLDPACRVILGVHDSNASLVPYLLQARDERFILNSTGTWCVAMRPCERMQFTEEELDLGVFYNCSVHGDPVKTAIFMGGQERLAWLDVCESLHAQWALPDFDAAIYQELITAADTFILPGVMPGTGPFPHSVSRLVHGDQTTTLAAIRTGASPLGLGQNPVRDYAVLCLSLALQTAEMLEKLELEAGMRVFIEGGFRHNVGYQQILGALCPNIRIELSSLSEATAFGCGLLTLAATRGCRLADLADTVAIDTTPVTIGNFPSLDRYRTRFLAHARSHTEH